MVRCAHGCGRVPINSSLLTIAPGWCKSSDSSLIRPRIHTISASDTPTQRSQALALLKRRGMTRLAEFSDAGITATTVGRMELRQSLMALASPMPPS
jgi:hypothetical protein